MEEQLISILEGMLEIQRSHTYFDIAITIIVFVWIFVLYHKVLKLEEQIRKHKKEGIKQ